MRRALSSLPLAFMATLALAAPAAAVDRLYRCDDLATRAKKTALNSRVYQGDAGWFFRDSDLNAFYMYSPQTMRFLARLHAVLANRGVTLALLPLPPKSVLEPTHAAAATADGDVLFDPGFARDQFAALVSTLKAAGLRTADVLGAIAADAAAGNGPDAGDYFFARDIHWRPRLARISASAVATLLAGEGIGGDKTFTTVKIGAAMNESNTNAIFNQLCAEPIPPEDFDIYRTEQANQSADNFLGDSDSAPPVDLVGTSFTDEAKPYNFTGFLREALSADVAAFSMSGGGVDTALYKWAHDGRAARDGLKALVWELPYPERLEPAAPMMERTIVPAIVGSCAGTPLERGHLDYALEPEQTVRLPLPASPAISGNGFYVTATLSDTAASAFVLDFAYADGEADVLPLIRPDRVSAVSTIFGELSADIDVPVASIGLTNRSAMKVSGTLTLCAYPDTLFVYSSISTGKAPS